MWLRSTGVWFLASLLACGIAGDVGGCGGKLPAVAPLARSGTLEEVAAAFASGLTSDPFFDKSADRLDVLRRRNELLDAVATPETRAKVLRLLYMETIDVLLTFGAAASTSERRALGDAAETYTRRAQALLAGEQPIGIDRDRYQSNLRFLSAVAWELEGKAPDATCLADLRFAAEHAGDYRSAAAMLLARTPSDDLYTKGLAAMEQGDPAAAVKAFSDHLQRFPADVEAERWRGLARVKKGELEGAVADFRACLAASPADPVALEGLGHAYFRLGQRDRAIAEWELASQHSPERAPVLDAYMRAARGGS